MSATVTADQFRRMTRARRASHMFRKTAAWGFEGNLLAVPIVALSAATAERGEVVPTLASTTASTLAYPVFMGTIAAGLSLVPGIGQGVAATLAFFGAMFPTAALEGSVSRSVRKLSHLGSNVRRLEMGQSLADTEAAYNNRLRAAQELNVTRLNSRRYLGQEARLLHR